jgi:DNA polymerase III alpha subunit (gram-positive type)
MSGILIGDIEADSLKPSVIWMVGITEFETGKFTSYHGEAVAEGIVRLSEADAFVGHYIEGYDVPVMERLTDGLVKFDRKRLIDTVPLARQHMPGLENYKLKTIGDYFGIPKLPFREFDAFSPEMEIYCERDCEITLALFRHILQFI